MSIRYGIIGAGMMAQEHIKNINLVGGVVTAFADPDKDMRALSAQTSNSSAKEFETHKEMLSQDLCDAFLIAAPNDLHHEILKDLIAYGKPILCEKPLCTTSKDCSEIYQLIQNKTAPIWVAMEYRYMPPVQRLLKEQEDGAAGTIKMVSIKEHRFPFLHKVGDWNRFNIRTGGTLVEKCCHFWDLMRLIVKSNPIRVYASGAVDVNHLDETYDGKQPDIIDNAFVIVDFENGTRGMLDLCMFSEGNKWQEIICATGDKAELKAYVPGPARFSVTQKESHAQFSIADRQKRTEVFEPIITDDKILQAGDHHGSTYYQHEKFLQLALGNCVQPEVTVEDGFWSVLIGEAAELSLRTHQPVSLKNIDISSFQGLIK